MRLTAFSDVSLRVLMLLSALEPGQKLSTQKIAEGVDTPYNHVAKAVAFLVNMGYLDSTRGRSGGVMLSMRVVLRPSALFFALLRAIFP